MFSNKGKLIIVLILLVVGFFYVISPSKLYGVLLSKEIEAKVADICNFAGDEKEKRQTFAIELHDQQGQIYTTTSYDKVWGVVTKGNFVKVKLYPAAPWKSNGGSWVNAKLINKITTLSKKNDNSK